MAGREKRFDPNRAGSRVYMARSEARDSQRELAEAIGTHQSRISDIEHGNFDYEIIRILTDIGDRYKLSYAYMLTFSDVPNIPAEANHLSIEEVDILTQWRRLGVTEKRLAQTMISALLNT